MKASLESRVSAFRWSRRMKSNAKCWASFCTEKTLLATQDGLSGIGMSGIEDGDVLSQ